MQPTIDTKKKIVFGIIWAADFFQTRGTDLTNFESSMYLGYFVHKPTICLDNQ